jgi:hypothetical protein
MLGWWWTNWLGLRLRLSDGFVRVCRMGDNYLPPIHDHGLSSRFLRARTTLFAGSVRDAIPQFSQPAFFYACAEWATAILLPIMIMAFVFVFSELIRIPIREILSVQGSA